MQKYVSLEVIPAQAHYSEEWNGVYLASDVEKRDADEKREWDFVRRTLVQCQEYLQKDGVRHSWIDSAIDIARARSA
jgi:hypothetical protein